MKKILITGAAGMLGLEVIKYLLTEGCYEITALDLKNSRTTNRLKKYKNRINIIYGDVCDKVLIPALVKDHDVIIHLASTLPPFADLKKDLSMIIDYEGTKNIVDAINFYNPKCHIIFASTMTMYKDSKNVSVKSKINLDEYDYFSQAKYDAENIIKEKLDNYTIYRLPLILGDLKHDPFMYHGRKNDVVSFITKEDASYAFVRGIKYLDKINKKTFNVVNDEQILYKKLLNNVITIYGINMKYILNRIFIEKNFYSPVCKYGNDLNDIINYRNDSLDAYYNRLKKVSKNRIIPRFIAKIFIREKTL